MSDLYIKQINDLQEWYEKELEKLPEFTMTEAEYKNGVDSLPEPYLSLTTEAFNEWLKEKNYELSYYQTCNAFFQAANKLSKFQKVG